MRKAFLLICLLNFLFLLTVCTTEDAPVEVLLVDYDFTLAQQKMIFPDEAIYDPGIYWFARGWGRSEKGWFWISDTEAVLYHYLLGSKVTFALECGTVRKLAVLGLKLTVFVNGRETADFTFRDKARVRTCVFTIPDAFVTQGLNELRFHLALPDSEKPDAGSKEANALNLFVTGLKIRARLDRRQRAEWGELNEGKRAESGWELVRLEGAGEEGGSRNEAKGADASSYPDVLMILLDAARPDHFGCYGYPRDTTPSIDRLAKDGIVFQEVFAPLALHALLRAHDPHRAFMGGTRTGHGETSLGRVLPHARRGDEESRLLHAGHFSQCLLLLGVSFPAGVRRIHRNLDESKTQGPGSRVPGALSQRPHRERPGTGAGVRLPSSLATPSTLQARGGARSL